MQTVLFALFAILTLFQGRLITLFFHYILYFESVFLQFHGLFSTQIISFYHMSLLSWT
ncbi:hypothetical protein LEP1GSC074_2352 [Leptospira noguchii str. Hook]|uniref:Uncharacterized protein n=1 Tax=Leptospira noguchii serovar Autumnalis str. ZUN142 TaxID=1085540 RepID=M6UE58_9LEPT|nr:hypothetical protein LEP1GSC186_1478 [Leptospira noguchii serovar Autumnalis str. ZUN142]EMS82707.1 hypothetical protein LEP1GSC074_2352 [Leptospira noguchii str. Hook]